MVLLSGLFLTFILLCGIALGAEDFLLTAFADDFSAVTDAGSQVYLVLLIFLSAVAVYVYYVWRDYEKDADFLIRKS
ncbi:hypothetical protein [Methanimicrococcus hongohii]|uniref:hypothetical protein n=1 Tax=Methanimicrococcus hongohii TaxID=3028295 RepID=UPI00292EAD69|nr:hypothetical protein [Methanimicrococcus sp. Hf6]